MIRSAAALRRLLAGSDATFASKSPAGAFSSSGYRVEYEAEKATFEGLGFYGLNSALAGRGVLVKDKAYYNLDSSELRMNGAMIVEHIPGIPLFARGITNGGVSKMSRAQFSKLLKQVTSHLSSVSNIFVLDGAISSSPECDAKVRIISDNPSAVLSLSKILWKMTSRAISHDPCPLTVYVAASISPIVAEVLGSGSKGYNGFAAADIERSSLIICGKGFANASVVKDALAALAAPVLTARGGLPISACSAVCPRRYHL